MPKVRVNGHEIFYQEAGSGFPILLGHSLCLDGEMFAPQIEALSSKYRVIAIDFRGHGRSDYVTRAFALDDYRDDVFGIADALDIRQFHYVGLSQGGMAGMRMALAQPARLAGLVLMDTSADAEEESKRGQYRLFAEQVRGRPMNQQMARVLLQMTFFSKRFLEAHPETEARYLAKLMANDTESLYYATMAVIERESIVGDLGKIRQPTLVMVGEMDTATVPAKSKQIADNLSSSEFVVIPGAAHVSTLENPDFVNEKLLTFFAGWET